MKFARLDRWEDSLNTEGAFDRFLSAELLRDVTRLLERRLGSFLRSAACLITFAASLKSLALYLSLEGAALIWAEFWVFASILRL